MLPSLVDMRLFVLELCFAFMFAMHMVCMTVLHQFFIVYCTF